MARSCLLAALALGDFAQGETRDLPLLQTVVWAPVAVLASLRKIANRPRMCGVDPARLAPPSKLSLAMRARRVSPVPSRPM